MSYVAIEFFVFVIIVCLLYYVVGLLFKGRFQWCVLLAGSIFFYALSIKSIRSLLVLAIPIIVSYVGGRILQREWKNNSSKKILLFFSIFLVLAPLLIVKVSDTLPIFHKSIIGPIGISFYTLQLIAYLCDCYKQKIVAQINPLKHILFVIFFPYIMQGPITRYEEMGVQLFQGHRYHSDTFMHGIQKILFGVFLKLMIADKAALFINNVFDGSGAFVGGFIFIATLLYSIQLYTDFYSCTLICQGVALTLGIKLPENFNHPYLSTSIKDFWRRWHISLGSWLRDYVYIPLGGSRKGKARKYLNIMITFLLCGFWHGNALQYIVWGGIHASFLIIGDCLSGIKEKAYLKIGIKPDSVAYKLVKWVGTFILVSIPRIIFRAKDLETGIMIIRNMFRYNPWSVFGLQLFDAGLDYRDFGILLLSLIALFVISYLQERGVSLHQWLQRQHLIIRWCIYIFVIVSFWVFGTYGFGFNAQDFIYGGF